MVNLPGEIDKLKVEIGKCFDIYKILEDFSYRFSKEDMDRKWNIYGYPRDTIELVAKRKKEMDKEKGKF